MITKIIPGMNESINVEIKLIFTFRFIKRIFFALALLIDYNLHTW